MVMLPKVSAKRRSEDVSDRIEELVVSGELAPGQHLDEVELAARFAVSRTPVREALIQLAAIGLIELRPRRGAVVAAVDPARIVEIFEVMAELEAMCARLAARRITEAEREALRVAHHACQTACQEENPDAYYYANELFHACLYRASHNEILVEEALRMRRRAHPYRRLQLRTRNRISASFEEHTEIVKAINEGHAELAAGLVRQHVLIQGERFGDLLAQLKTALPVERSRRPEAPAFKALPLG